MCRRTSAGSFRPAPAGQDHRGHPRRPDLAGVKAVRISGKGVEGKVTEAVSDKNKTLKLAVTVAADADLGSATCALNRPPASPTGSTSSWGSCPR